MDSSPSFTLDEDKGVISSKSRQKKLLKKARKSQTLIPIVPAAPQSSVHVLPKTATAENVKKQPSNTCLADFPALPTQSENNVSPIQLRIGTSTSFSEIVAKKTDPPQFKPINVQHVHEISSFKKKSKNTINKERTRTSNANINHEHESVSSKNFNASDCVIKSESCDSLKTTVRPEINVKKEPSHVSRHSETKTSSSFSKNKVDEKPWPSDADQSTSKCHQANTNSQPLPNAEKKKRKRKHKKSVKTEQGKIHTLSQERYLAITENNVSPPKLNELSSSNDINLNDETQYPMLGVPNRIVFKEENETSQSVSRDYNENLEQLDSSVNSGTLRSPKRGVEKQTGLSYEKKMKEKPIVEKKFNAPIQLNLLDMLLKMKKSEKKKTKFQPLCVKRERINIPEKGVTLNSLDSSAPSRKRGKERETPRKPKLSKMKKLILKERLERKLRLSLIAMNINQREPDVNIVPTEDRFAEDYLNPVTQLGEQLNNICLETVCSEVTGDTFELGSEELVIDRSERLESEDSSNPLEIGKVHLNDSPVAETLEEKLRLRCAKRLLHCKRFREYCNQFISEEIDILTTNLLEELVRFQDRLFLKDPVKARAKKRLVCGMKEITKNLKLRKLKLVIVAPDIEEINCEGGLNDALQTILSFCSNYYTPLIFSLPRRKLGKVCKKNVPLSCVGIFNYEGTEDIHRHLLELVEEARIAYKETLENVQQNLSEDIIQALSPNDIDHAQVEDIKRRFWGFTK